MRPNNNKPLKITSLQVFRALAAIVVVLFHITIYAQEKLKHALLGGTFSFGHTGVDFFFVLSGFIIFYAHHDVFGDRSQLRTYAFKRFIRIFPIYWIVTLTKLAVLLAVPEPLRAETRSALNTAPLKRSEIEKYLALKLGDLLKVSAEDVNAALSPEDKARARPLEDALRKPVAGRGACRSQ